MLNAKNLFQRFGSGFMLAMMSLSALGSAAPAVAYARNEMKKASGNTRTVTLAGSENGSTSFGDSSASSKTFRAGDEVRVMIKENDGYKKDRVYAVEEESKIAVNGVEENNVLTFTMPDADVKVYSSFAKKNDPIRGPTEVKGTFDEYIGSKIKELTGEDVTVTDHRQSIDVKGKNGTDRQKVKLYKGNGNKLYSYLPHNYDLKGNKYEIYQGETKRNIDYIKLSDSGLVTYDLSSKSNLDWSLDVVTFLSINVSVNTDVTHTNFVEYNGKTSELVYDAKDKSFIQNEESYTKAIVDGTEIDIRDQKEVDIFTSDFSHIKFEKKNTLLDRIKSVFNVLVPAEAKPSTISSRDFGRAYVRLTGVGQAPYDYYPTFKNYADSHGLSVVSGENASFSVTINGKTYTGWCIDHATMEPADGYYEWTGTLNSSGRYDVVVHSQNGSAHPITGMGGLYANSGTQRVADFDIDAPFGDYNVQKTFENVKSNYYNKSATFTLNGPSGSVSKTVSGNGNAYFEDLIPGTYTLTETGANGFVTNPPQTVTVIAGRTGSSAPTTTINNVAKRGNFNLQKDTGDNYISGKNKNYSLAGAHYELILKNDNSLKYTLTTNEQGQASLQNIERGEYTLREVSAPRGYALNTQGEDVYVRDETNGKQTRDNPRYDPVVLTLEKADKERNALNANQYGPQGNASLVGAVFTLTLYEENNLTEAQIKAGQGTKLWSVDITTKDVNGKAVAKTSDKSYLSNYVPYKTDAASLDNIFDPRAGLKIAGGTFAVVEKSAPTGYLVDGVQFNGKAMYVKNVDVNTGNGSRVTVEQPTNETVKATEDKKKPGRLRFNKKDADSHGIVPQGDAEMKTTTFDVYNKSKNPIVYDGREYAVNAKVTTVTVDPTTLVASLRNELPYGEYEIVEASTHESYHKSAPTQRATLDDAHRDMDLTFENQVKRGSIEIKKHDADTDSTTPQGDATLQATYTIKNKSKEAVFVKGKWYAKDAVITTVTTDLNSKTVKVDDLPVGTYLVEETGTHNTYHLGGYDRDNTTKFTETVHITPAKLEVKLTTIKGENETIAPENFVKRGSIKVEKHDNQTNNTTPQGDAKLKATFNVVNKSANAIWYYKGSDRTQGKLVKPNEVVDTITTDDKTRIATITNLPVGTYEVIETAASESYDINPYRRTVKVTAEKLDHLLNNANQGANDAAAANIVKRGGVQVKKIDNDFVRNEWAQGDAGFEGAEFTIINRSAEAVYNKATGQKYDVGATVAVIRANAQGVASSGLDTLPIGTYEIYESKAPTGYLLNEKWRKKFSVTPTDAGKFIKLMDIPEKAKHNYDANEAGDKLAVADKVIRGGVRVHKFDTNRNTTEPKGDEETPQGDASIKGAVIEIVNKSPRHVFYEGKEYAPEAIIGTITTNDKGIAETANNVLPYGTYELREKTAPESYHLNNTWKVTFSIRENGKVVEANSSATSPLNEDIKRGSIEIKKHDADTDSTTPQGDATLQATYTIKNKSKEAVFVKGKWYAKDAVITTVTTDLNSKTVKVDDLPVGTYLVEETGTHNTYHLGGYDRDNTTKFTETVHITPAKLEVKLTTIKGENETIAPENFVKRGSIKVEKHDNQTNNTTPQGDAKLKATFNVVNKSANAIWYYKGSDRTQGKLVKPNEVVDTITTDDKTRIATITNLPVGTYEVIETAASESYDINPYRRTVKVTAEKLDHLLNNANQGANDAAAANIVKRGGVQVKKIDNDFVRNEWAQGDAGFEGAEFTIINRSAEAVYNKATGQKYDVGATVAVIRANAQGVASSGLDTLPIGTYEIYESKAPTGYLLNEKWRKTFTVRPANAGTFIQFTQIPEKSNHNIDQNNANDKLAIADKVIRGDVRVHKFDHDRNTTDPKDDSKLPQGDATLEGAKLEVINKSPHHVFYNGKEYAPNDVIDVLTTDAKGDAGAKNLPYGTYMIREKSAPTGYLLNSEWTTTFSIRENGKVVEANSETTAPLNEKVIRGFVKVQKVDKERTTNRNENQGDATLAGAVISVINESKEAVYVNGKWHAKGEVVATMTTNDKGIAVLDNNASLPYGSYSLKETKASEGYLLNDKWKVNFQIREDNKVVDVTSQVLEQQIIRGDVEVIKQDLELSKSEAIAGKDHNGANGEAASLNGITFEVRNASAKSVNIAGKFVNPGDVVTTLVTKWNAERKQYMVETTGKYLPYGTYTVQEIATNNSYVLTDGAKRTFTIRKDGEVVKQVAGVHTKDQIKAIVAELG